MKVYISVDIEGITGVTSWNEVNESNREHNQAKNQMLKETLAACYGAIDAGATEIFVKDAHLSGRNMDIDKFPKEVKLIRGWTGEPVSMLAGLDSSFDALVMIGYHSAAGEDGNPLAHTINSSVLSEIRIDGEIVSEFHLNMLSAMERGVPTVFLSGDKMLCENVKKYSPKIRTVSVKEGIGGATFNINTELACDLIRENVKEVLQENIENKDMDLPNKFFVEMDFMDHKKVNRAKYYPGVEKISAKTVKFKANTVEELMTTRMFIM